MQAFAQDSVFFHKDYASIALCLFLLGHIYIDIFKMSVATICFDIHNF